MPNPIARNLLDYWFGPRPLTPEDDRARGKLWFGGGADQDYDIERRFGKLVTTARAGSFDSWAADPESCLALILLLDQLPRNLYRGQAAAFASDARALELTRDLVQAGALEEFGYPERAFALMPYQHVESVELQREGLALYREQAAAAPDAWRAIMEDYANFAQQHADIIERFGRFPHRNAVLGRASTPDELAYLADGAARFGQ